LQDLYLPQYFHDGGYVGGISGSGDPKRFDSILDTIRSSMAYNNALLEVGCADGLFLSKARERGWQVKGVEIADYAARYAREQRRLDVRTGTLEQAEFRQEPFGCVYMGDVLEHLPSPKETLAEIWRVLSHRGILVLAVPIFYNTLYAQISHLYLLVRQQITGQTHMMMGPPRHLYEFTPRTLRRLLVLSGFEITRTIYQTSSRTFQRIFSMLAQRITNVNSDRVLVYVRKR